MTPAIIGIASASIVILILSIICYRLFRNNKRIGCENCSAAQTVESVASFVDAVKTHAPSLKDDEQIQRLAANILVDVEYHRQFRAKYSPGMDLLIKDLKEMAGPHGPREKQRAVFAHPVHA